MLLFGWFSTVLAPRVTFLCQHPSLPLFHRNRSVISPPIVFTFAMVLAQNGVDLFTIQKLLGHKSFATTQRYAHHYTESLRRGINVLDEYAETVKRRSA